MASLNVLAAVQIGDSTGDFENPIVCTGRESQPVHGIFEDGAAVLIQLAVFLDELRRLIHLFACRTSLYRQRARPQRASRYDPSKGR